RNCPVQSLCSLDNSSSGCRKSGCRGSGCRIAAHSPQKNRVRFPYASVKIIEIHTPSSLSSEICLRNRHPPVNWHSHASLMIAAVASDGRACPREGHHRKHEYKVSFDTRGILNMNRKRKLDTSRSHFSIRRSTTLFGVVAIGAAVMALARVVNATPAIISGIILLVGADESQRVVNWYASDNTSQVVEVAPTSDLQGGAFPSDATRYEAVVAAN